MSKPKVALIIDDNEEIREIYAKAFQAAEYEVYTSQDGLWGITQVGELNPNVILLDIMMPEMSGYDFLKALRNNTSLHVPVVIVSNLSQKADIDQAMAAGADLYLRKSDFSGTQLVAAVEEFLITRNMDQKAPA